MSTHAGLADAVAALFEKRADRYIYLGSSFFVTKDGILVTAAHVLPSSDPGSTSLAISFGEGPFYEVHLGLVDSKVDLALLSTEFQPRHWLHTAHPAEVCMFDEVVCYEYSQTRNQSAESDTKIVATPSGRAGSITRFMSSTELDGVCRAPCDDMLVVSFPTLHGASGAPVVRRSDGHVVGVIVQSWSLNESPAEVQETIEMSDESSGDDTLKWPHSSVKEIRRFMVPQGLAVNVRHLIAMLAPRDTS